MYRMAVITMLCPKSLSSRLDVARCTKMALIHDMAESLVGDITPVDGISKPEKSRRESTTMDFVQKQLLGSVIDGGAEAGDSIREVWQEYEDGKTLESKFVHDVDKLELILQMVEYEKYHDGKMDLGEFSRVARKVELEEVKKWCDEVLDERARYWKEQGKKASYLTVDHTDEA